MYSAAVTACKSRIGESNIEVNMFCVWLRETKKESRIGGVMENIDKTIDAICVWIKKELEAGKSNRNHEISKMAEALAELVSARREKL